MKLENGGEVEKDRTILNNALGSIDEMNRTARKENARILKLVTKNPILQTLWKAETKPLKPINGLLDHGEDIQLFTESLREYESAQRSDILGFRLYKVLTGTGVTESNYRKLLTSEGFQQSGLTRLYQGVKPSRLNGSALGLINALTRAIAHSPSYKDEDADELVRILGGDENISISELFTEMIRSRGESIALMGMNIAWLNNRGDSVDLTPVVDESGDLITVTEVAEDLLKSEPVNVGVSNLRESEDFILAGWKLFWTKRAYSSEPSHLVSIPTDSRITMLETLKQVAKGEYSIKPESILRALQFYLQKDIMQRALSARVRYGPEGIRDWAKIKRGKDRIQFLIPDTEQLCAIFFVINRDDAYKVLERY